MIASSVYSDVREYENGLVMILWARRSLLKTSALYRTYASQTEHPEFDYAAAREWYKTFNPLQSLRNLGEVTYARSSGPGGQNVNKYAL